MLFASGCDVTKRKVIVERPRVQFEIPKNKVEKIVLKNGMTVLMFPTKQVPKVLVQIAYNIGSDVEESGERGLAHLIEHMIFKGTDKLSEADITAIARKYGATVNAFTSKDMTSYYFEVDKNNWKPFIGIFADCMQNARFEEQHLASEMKAVLQELRMLKDSHGHLFFHKACEILFPSNHPYHHPIIGYKEDLLSLSAARLHTFYKKYYHPHRAALFIVGDFDPSEAAAEIHANFDSIPKSTDGKPKNFPQEMVEVSSQMSRIYEEIKKDYLAFYWKIPGLKDKTKILASVVDSVLGSGEGSLLHRRLVDNDKIATSVGTQLIQFRESGLLCIIVEPKKGMNDNCRAAIKEELQNVIDKGIDSEILVKTVRRNEREFVQMLQSIRSLTVEWITSFFATGDEFELFRRVDEFYKINEQMVKGFVKLYLDPFLMNELQLLPIPENKKDRWIENKRLSEAADGAILKKFERTQPVEKPRIANNLAEPKELEFSFPKPDKIFVLDNGLKVILRRSTFVPLIYASCHFKDAGFLSHSREGQLANIMMSMLMEGSVGFSKQENVDFFELFGADYAFSLDGSQLSMVNVGYKAVIERMFHILTKPDFSKKSLEKLKSIFVGAYEGEKDSPMSVASRILQTMIYKNHPFAWTFDEMIESAKKLSIDDLTEIHKRLVSPKGIIFTVSGDFDLDEMEKAIKEIFGSWKGSDYARPTVTKGAFVPGEQNDHKMLRDQAVLLFGRPSELDIYHPDRIPLRLLNFISFYSIGSRIYKLREQSGLFYHASGSFCEGATRTPGFDYAVAILSINTLADAEKSIKNLIDGIGKNGITKSELSDARRWLLKGLIDQISSVAAIGSTFGYLEEYELGFDYYDKVLHRVQKEITVETMNEICKKYANSKDFSRVRVGRV